jgi:hypothetical protein
MESDRDAQSDRTLRTNPGIGVRAAEVVGIGDPDALNTSTAASRSSRSALKTTVGTLDVVGSLSTSITVTTARAMTAMVNQNSFARLQDRTRLIGSSTPP